jgi:hypothetical protein
MWSIYKEERDLYNALCKIWVTPEERDFSLYLLHTGSHVFIVTYLSLTQHLCAGSSKLITIVFFDI